ncbi:hypothetical protein ABID29_001690 [Streptococcus rupicaprae]|uniref:Uncharacterized protein n=1 Tax=Streptococcus rupicaprae TaxID=759619 RepID=A0ABV2FJ31_9STRE
MKKNLLLLLTLVCSILIIWGLGKLYMAYNLSHYAGYYVQHLPRKEGTNPELVIVLTHLDDIERPNTHQLTYKINDNGTIIQDNSVILSLKTYIHLWNHTEDKKYIFDKFGSYSYHYTNDIDSKNFDSQYQEEAEVLLDKIITPILEAQPKPNINLQKLFNEKYYKQFN